MRGMHIPSVGLGTYRGSRLPYVHTQCMPIWVPGSQVPRSSGPDPGSTEYSVSCIVATEVLLTYYQRRSILCG